MIDIRCDTSSAAVALAQFLHIEFSYESQRRVDGWRHVGLVRADRCCCRCTHRGHGTRAWNMMTPTNYDRGDVADAASFCGERRRGSNGNSFEKSTARFQNARDLSVSPKRARSRHKIARTERT